MVMKTKKTTRRLQVKNALANAIREAKTPTYSQIVEAKALARKLMGIPDLYSEKYLNKERKHLMKLSRIVSECAQFITFYSEDRGAFFVIIKAPQSSGFEFTSGKAQEIESFLLAD